MGMHTYPMQVWGFTLQEFVDKYCPHIKIDGIKESQVYDYDDPDFGSEELCEIAKKLDEVFGNVWQYQVVMNDPDGMSDDLYEGMILVEFDHSDLFVPSKLHGDITRMGLPVNRLEWTTFG